MRKILDTTYGWFAEKDGAKRIPIYIGMAGKNKSFITKGTLFRGVSELQRNTFTSNSPDYNRLDTDFIVGTAIQFFVNKGYVCVWEHIDNEPKKELEIVTSEKPILQNIYNAKIKKEFQAHKDERGYWQVRKNEKCISEAMIEVFRALEKLNLK